MKHPKPESLQTNLSAEPGRVQGGQWVPPNDPASQIASDRESRMTDDPAERTAKEDDLGQPADA